MTDVHASYRSPHTAGPQARWAPWALLFALLLCWVLWYPQSPDLAAQAYRIDLFAKDGFALWDNGWYGGHYLLSYSLIFPAIADFLGLRVAGVLAVTASSVLFWLLLGEKDTRRRGLSVALFVVGAAGDLYIGRVAFALGVTFGLASALAAVRGSRVLCVTCSVGCAAASPVAAAFLGLVACGELLAHRQAARAACLGVPALAVVAVISTLFPEGGYEPFAFSSLLAALGACALILLLVPRGEKLARYTAGLYLAALLLAYVIQSPMGSNAVRFGVLFAPATLVLLVRPDDVQRRVLGVRHRLAHNDARGSERPGATSGTRTSAFLLAASAAVLVLWQVNGPLAQSVTASASASSSYAFYMPAIRYLDGRSGGAPMRIEVPFTDSHWDAAILGTHFALARGWERQIDTRFDSLFYEPGLTSATYERWLDDNGVRFVVLSDAPLDFSSVQEGALVAGGLPFLHLVFRSANWRIYEVRDARPLASGPGELVSISGDGFTLLARHAGQFLVRIHYTPYWSVAAGMGTTSEGADDWTELDATRAGTIRVDADFSLPF